MRYRWLAGLLVLGVMAGGAGAAAYHRSGQPSDAAGRSADGLNSDDRPSEAAADSPRDARTSPVPVRVAEVMAVADDTASRSLTGIVKARYETPQAFRVSGKILRRHVEVGDRVVAGQVLFELEPDDFELQVKAAAAALQVAEANVVQTTADEKRQRQLIDTNAISDSEYERSLSARDIAIGQRENANRQLELSRNQLSYCRLTADASGLITAINAEAGQVVTVGTAVCQVAQDDQLEAIVDIPENRLPQIQSSSGSFDATATFWSLPGVECQARVRELSPVADPLTRTYRCRLTLLAPPPQVRLGMTTTVDLKTAITAGEQPQDLFAVPSAALFQHAGQPAVWAVCEEQGTIEPVVVQLVKVGTDRLVVNGPLAVGQPIVSAGAHMLDASVRVRVWERQP